jgi:hypothetical protein
MLQKAIYKKKKKMEEIDFIKKLINSIKQEIRKKM